MNDTYIPKHNGKKKTIKRRRLKKQTVVWELIFLLSVFVLIISLTKVFVWFKDNDKTEAIAKEIIQEIPVEEVLDDKETEIINKEKNPDKESDYWSYIKQSLINVDIDSLKEKNGDTIGWIKVNNTNINYPFVQTKDNDYYLSHAFDKSNNNAGWVFLDYRNNSDFSDKNNIIYAHARRDNSMFGSLRNVLKKEWYSNKDNHIIKLSTANENTMWQIFSVYKIPVETYYITTQFTTSSQYKAFLETITKRSIHQFNTTVDSSDKILTLSTCSGEDDRIVVHAKLIKRSSKNT